MQIRQHVLGDPPTSRPAPAPRRHPPSQVLADFLVCDCSPGTSALLARHMDLCGRCRSRVQLMGATGSPLSGVEQGPWRVLVEGVDVSPLAGAAGLGEAVYVVRAAAGARVPLRAPIAVAEVLLLEGRSEADGEIYVPGDYAVFDAAWMTADAESGCTAMVTALLPQEADHAA
jgi:anti-sigma factor ChrR (cupin superfamily)